MNVNFGIQMNSLNGTKVQNTKAQHAVQVTLLTLAKCNLFMQALHKGFYNRPHQYPFIKMDISRQLADMQ